MGAFNEVNKCFTEAPILAKPNLSKPFTLEADMSKYVTGAVLSQKSGNKCLYLVALYSKL